MALPLWLPCCAGALLRLQEDGVSSRLMRFPVVHESITIFCNEFIGVNMSIRAQDVVPISEARARLTELSDEVVGGAEKLLTKNGAAYVALIDARKLDYYHALEAEHASLLLLAEADTALRELLAGERVSADALQQALAG